MKECLVSITGKEGQAHTVAVKANSLFDAASQAAEQWARFWWYTGDEIIEVDDGARRWKVKLERVRRARFGH